MIDARASRDRIREATLADADHLARLLTPLGYPLTRADVEARWGACSEAGNRALVAELDGRVLGVVTLARLFVLHRPRPVGRITSLIVEEGARGRGWGRALMEAARDTLKAEGCGMIEVTSHVRRTDAHRFYRHLDYEQTSFRFMKSLERA